MPFGSKVDVEWVDGRTWRLMAPVVYATRGQTFIVPAGFLTDFASIPRLLWTCVGDPCGPWAPAAVVHDYLYRLGLRSRRESDRIFREAMLDLGIDDTICWTFWLALRCAGWWAYNQPVTRYF